MGGRRQSVFTAGRQAGPLGSLGGAGLRLGGHEELPLVAALAPALLITVLGEAPGRGVGGRPGRRLPPLHPPRLPLLHQVPQRLHLRPRHLQLPLHHLPCCRRVLPVCNTRVRGGSGRWSGRWPGWWSGGSDGEDGMVAKAEGGNSPKVPCSLVP